MTEQINTIIVYDVSSGNNKARKILHKFGCWNQNSVFTANLSEAKREDLTDKLKSIIKDNDNIIIFEIHGNTKTTILGNEKGKTSNILD